MESDNKGLIQMLKKEIVADVDLEIYVHDIWQMASLFQLVRFCFTPRQCNRATYSIAAYVVKHGGRFGWDELGPEFLFNVLAEDANVAIRI